MDTPTQRMLKIGKATIGLIGLDIALNKALAEKIPVENIDEHLYQEIRTQNYIPPGMMQEYKAALKRE
ncbi:MAG: thioredoxin family protein, partial [Desulfocapsa sp.]|nr:thioredoxin family protein [Desulfocapsa sp.]